MSIIRTIARPVAIAFALAFAATAAPAFAETPKGDATELDAARQHKNFPIAAGEFQQIVDKRLAHAREKVEALMVKHSVPEAMRTQIRKDFDDSAELVRAAARRVEADGKVTREEAKEVRDLASDLRQKLMEKYAPNAPKRAHRRA